MSETTNSTTVWGWVIGHSL